MDTTTAFPHRHVVTSRLSDVSKHFGASGLWYARSFIQFSRSYGFVAVLFRKDGVNLVYFRRGYLPYVSYEGPSFPPELAAFWDRIMECCDVSISN